MKTIKFYWNDLTEKKQKEIEALVGNDHNWDVFPIATLDIEEDDELTVYEPITCTFVRATKDELYRTFDEFKRSIVENLWGTISDWLSLIGIDVSEHCMWNIIGWNVEDVSSLSFELFPFPHQEPDTEENEYCIKYHVSPRYLDGSKVMCT